MGIVDIYTVIWTPRTEKLSSPFCSKEFNNHREAFKFAHELGLYAVVVPASEREINWLDEQMYVTASEEDIGLS